MQNRAAARPKPEGITISWVLERVREEKREKRACLVPGFILKHPASCSVLKRTEIVTQAKEDQRTCERRTKIHHQLVLQEYLGAHCPFLFLMSVCPSLKGVLSAVIAIYCVSSGYV